MSKQLTINLGDDVYDGLKDLIGENDFSEFIESLIRPHVIGHDLDLEYCQMARDEEREAEALQWAEGTIGDLANEAR